MTHGPNAVRSYEHTASQEAKRVARACLKCTKSKQRCDGQQPCDRCQKKRCACEYTTISLTGIDEPCSSSHLSPPPASSDPFQAEVYHQSTAGPNNGSLGHTSVSQSTDFMDEIFNPFPSMPFNTIDPTLGVFPMPLFFGPNLHDRDPLNEQALPPASSMPPLDGSSQYSSRQGFSDISAVESLNAPLAEPQLMNPVNGTATKHLQEHTDQGTTPNLSPPDLPLSEEEIIATEDFRHVEQVSESTYNAIMNFYREHCQKVNMPNASLPNIQVVSTFVQLYFEYFHPLMPIVHLSSFKPTPDKWILIAAIASVGCQYSRIPTRSRMLSFFWHLLQRIILNLVRSPRRLAEIKLSNS